MKRISILGFLLKFRSYVENTYSLLEKVYERIGSLEGLVANHIMHRLDEHESMLKEIYNVVVGEKDIDTTNRSKTEQGDQ